MSFAMRVVSTAPGITETLFALGASKDVIAVSQYCSFPPQVKALPKVGGYYDINHEMLLRLHPDIVFLMDGNEELERFLKKHKIKYSVFKSRSLNDVFKMIIGIGKHVNHGNRAKKIVDDIKVKMESTKKDFAKNKEQVVLIVIDQEVHKGSVEAVYAVGKDKYFAPMLELYRCKNVINTKIPYPRITKEILYGLKPDKIIVLGAGKVSQYSWLIKNNKPNVVFIDDDGVKHPGPRILETLDLFQKILK
jgi:iron complex transport system substrate-binding protein